MSELSFEQMLEDSVKTIRNGEIVQGTVIDVKDDEIILNIGYKADGIITKSEYSNDASLVLTDAVHVGDSMEAKVLKVNDGEGQVILTYKRLAAETASSCRKSRKTERTYGENPCWRYCNRYCKECYRFWCFHRSWWSRRTSSYLRNVLGQS